MFSISYIIIYGDNNRMSSSKLIQREKNGVVYFTSPLFEKISWLSHGISTRHGGVSTGCCSTMNLKPSIYDDNENINKNYQLFCKAVGINPENVVTMDQVHGNNVEVVTKDHICTGCIPEFDFTNTDGMITDVKNRALFGFSADCPLVLLADNKKHVIGICHSGWRGTCKNITSVTINKMKEQFGCNPDDMLAFVAPSICQECFEVGDDVIEEINKLIPESLYSKAYYKKNNDKYQLNLWEVIRYILADHGIKQENIEITDMCSKCNPDLFFSHRHMGVKRGTGAAFLMIKE